MDTTLTEIRTEGRPDFADHNFGKTRAKRHPKHVYGNSMGLLVHKIAYVELHWYKCGSGGKYLVRLNHPKIIVATQCGQHFFYRLQNEKPRSTMCEIPKTDAVLCGRCQGEGPVFGKNKEWTVTKREAKDRLGCADVVQLSDGTTQP